MAGATLSLGRTAEKNRPDPVFDPEAHYGEVHGDSEVRYVQGDALFNFAKKFVRSAPKEMRLQPLSPEQEAARRRQLMNNKRFFSAAKPQNRDAAIPKSVLDAEKENAQARAAEHRSA